MSSKYSRHQWLIILVYGVVNTLSAICASLSGPFYPMVAETKGATPFQYGLVFGSFSLILIFASLLSGMMINKLGAVKVSFYGLLIIGVTSALFGCVYKFNDLLTFILTSIAIRIFQGLGFGMVRNSGIAIISREFSENVEIPFAIVQTFFSTGFMIGPVAGGALFELGGFYLPFVFIGSLLVSMAFLILFLPQDHTKKETKSIKQIGKLLRQPSIILGILIMFGSYLNFTFILSLLEPHIKILNLSPIQIGLIFMCNMLANTFSSFFWGLLREKFDSPLFFCSISATITICGLLLLSPAPYFPLTLNIYTCIFGLLIHGIGIAGEQVLGFSILSSGAFLAGLPKNIQTSGLISTLFTSSSALGSFIGPLTGGYLIETFGFPWGSHLFILYHFLLSIVLIIFHFSWRSKLNLHDRVKLSSSTETFGRYRNFEWP